MATPELRISPPRPPAVEDETIDLWPIVLDIWSVRWILVIGTLSAAITAYAAMMALPRTFEATATISIIESTLRNSLVAPAFSVEAYARLAESNDIRDLVRDELRRANAIGPSQEIGPIRTVLYPSSGGPTPYLPMLGIVAQAPSPEQAQQVANAWATTFAREQTRLARETTEGSVAFVLSEHPKASQALTDAERELDALRERQARELLALQARADVESKRALLESREQQLVSLQRELAETSLLLLRSKERLAQLQPELAKTSPVVTLSRAISEDALWQHLAGSSNGTTRAEELMRQRLQTQETNPVYTELSRQLAEERVRVNTLVPVEGQLQKQVQDAAAAVDQTREELQAAEFEVNNLQRRHGLDWAFQQRRVDEARTKLLRISEHIGEAEMARAQNQPTLRVGARAALPGAPIALNVPLNVAYATGIGFFISLLGAWVAHRATHRTT